VGIEYWSVSLRRAAGLVLAVLLMTIARSAHAEPTALITSVDAVQDSAGRKKITIAGFWNECGAVEVMVPCVNNTWRPATLDPTPVAGTEFKRWSLPPLLLCPGLGGSSDTCLGNRCLCYQSGTAEARCVVGQSPIQPPDEYAWDVLDCAPPAAGQCGDGFIDAGEECDDGNTTGGDGCNAGCATESGACGNGNLQPGEQCDDGNSSAGDGCSPTCGLEPGSGSGAPKCGNGTIEAGEQCDDGNLAFDDGCTPACKFNNGGGTGHEDEDDECSGIASVFGCPDGDWPAWLCWIIAALVVAATAALVYALSSYIPGSGISVVGAALVLFDLMLSLYLAGCGCEGCAVWVIIGLGIVAGVALAIYMANPLQLGYPGFWFALVFAVVWVVIQTNWHLTEDECKADSPGECIWRAVGG